MKTLRTFISIWIVFTSITVFGQNLVPNGSFEDYTQCPDSCQIDRAFPWFTPDSTIVNTPDYFHKCANNGTPILCGVPRNIVGYQIPKDGDAYVGIYVYGSNWKEYIQVKLNTPLMMDSTYVVKFFVVISENSGVGIDGIGLYLSQNEVVGKPLIAPLNYSPQIYNTIGSIITDTVSWTEVSGTYKAMGGEQYITIGNFLDDSSTQIQKIFNYPNPKSYIFIDGVCIAKNPADCGVDVGLPKNKKFNIARLVKITDMTGREIDDESIFHNQILLYHYSDGSIRKKVQIE